MNGLVCIKLIKRNFLELLVCSHILKQSSYSHRLCLGESFLCVHLHRRGILDRLQQSRSNNKKFWKELICLLSLHYLKQNSPLGSRDFIIFLYLIYLRRKLNSLQRYDIAQNCRILHRVVQRLSQHNLKISHHRHI
jgi:hypothetical protein